MLNIIKRVEVPSTVSWNTMAIAFVMVFIFYGCNPTLPEEYSKRNAAETPKPIEVKTRTSPKIGDVNNFFYITTVSGLTTRDRKSRLIMEPNRPAGTLEWKFHLLVENEEPNSSNEYLPIQLIDTSVEDSVHIWSYRVKRSPKGVFIDDGYFEVFKFDFYIKNDSLQALVMNDKIALHVDLAKSVGYYTLKSNLQNLPSEENDPQNIPTVKTHVVKDGETLSQIALDYGVEMKDLMKMNGLRSKTIRKGQTLKIRSQ